MAAGFTPGGAFSAHRSMGPRALALGRRVLVRLLGGELHLPGQLLRPRVSELVLEAPCLARPRSRFFTCSPIGFLNVAFGMPASPRTSPVLPMTRHMLKVTLKKRLPGTKRPSSRGFGSSYLRARARA